MATTYIRRLDGRRPPQGSGRPSSGGSRFNSNSSGPSRGNGRMGRDGVHRSSGGRTSPNQGGRGGGGKRGYQEMQVDLSRLINKAVPAAETPAYIPKNAFIDFQIEEALKANIISKGYVNPTPIQDQSIEAVLAGKDIVGMAQTGTGKTAAFLIPLINKVIKDPSERILVMVPTRELAIQIEQEFYGFSKRLNINSVVCVGGAGIDPQIRVLRRKPSFVIGTPGRLKDLMDRRELDLSKFATVVLDEADRMLDMGFLPDMRFILGHMPEKRHTLFFSATMSREIENLVGSFLVDPVRVMVKTRDTASTIDQDVVRAGRGEEKFNKLVELLKQPEFEKTLVFGRTKFGVERMTRDLVRSGIRAESIHGDKTHGKRQKALSLFKADHVDVLVATDVAARGLDISGVSHVINYDLPATYEDYTHRIGRTGRAGAVGSALTFIEG